jgi:hypothetical protein
VKKKIIVLVTVGGLLLVFSGIFFYISTVNHWGNKPISANVYTAVGTDVFGNKDIAEFSANQNGFYAVSNSADVNLWAKTVGNNYKNVMSNTDMWEFTAPIKKNQHVVINRFDNVNNTSLLIVLDQNGSIVFYKGIDNIFAIIPASIGIIMLLIALFVVIVHKRHRQNKFTTLYAEKDSKHSNSIDSSLSIRSITESIPKLTTERIHEIEKATKKEQSKLKSKRPLRRSDLRK